MAPIYFKIFYYLKKSGWIIDNIINVIYIYIIKQLTLFSIQIINNELTILIKK